MNKRVLIVDNYESTVIALGLLFDNKGFTVINSRPITSVETAISMIQFYKPDIILLDHELTNGGDCGLDVAVVIATKNISDALILSTSITVGYSKELTGQYRKAGIYHFPDKTFPKILQCIEGNCGCYLPASVR